MIRGGTHRRRDGGWVLSIRGHEPHARPERLLSASAKIMISAGDHHPCALAPETPGDGQAQAGGTPGNQRALSLQQPHGPLPEVDGRSAC
jgi:hypothetical protein